MTHRSSSQYNPGTNGTSWVVPVPAGAASGDIVVIGGYKENTAAVSGPDGTWTEKVALTTNGASQGSLHVWWKRLTAADSGTYTFTWTGSVFRAAVSGSWSGRITSGDPFDGTPGTAESVAGVTTLNVSTSPTASGGDAFGFWTNFNGGATFTPPTNYTERQDIPVITLDTRDAVASGSTGNVTATSTITDFMKAFLGVLTADLGVDPSPSPVWFPGFMTGNGFPGFMLPASQSINPAALAYDINTSGTTYLQSLDGSIGPAGALIRQPGKTLAGGVAPAGALAKQANKAIGGSVIPTGTLARATLKTLAGSITPTGVLTSSLVRLLSVAGSITPTGSLLKQDNKPLTASITPVGALTKQTQKRLAGTTTPTGVVANIKTILLSLAGGITPGGALVKQVRKTLTGAAAPAGTLVKQTAKRLTGSVAPAGAAATTKVILRSFAGAVTPTGVIAKRVGKALSGSVSPNGVVLKMLSRLLGGGITPTGAASTARDIPQFNGTSTSTVTGLASTASLSELHAISTITSSASHAEVTGLDAASAVGERDSSTPGVSDG